jgi:Fe-S oxidoreductase
MGDETLFMDLAKKNTRRLRQYNFKKIVALCPHCFNTLKHEYPSLGGTYPSLGGTYPSLGGTIKVVHAVEFVMDLIREKRITLKYPLAKKVALHDPCYLGRANHIYEPLRQVTKAVPGTQLIELKRNREQSFCCGGGGGRMWLHERLGQKINQTRSEEIVASTTDVVGTACPYCQTMLEDGIGSLELEKPPKVLDIIELVASSLG